MMRNLLALIVIVGFLSGTTAVLGVQGKGGAQGPKVAATQGPKSTGTGGPKTKAGPKTTGGGPKSTAGGPKSTRAPETTATGAKSTSRGSNTTAGSGKKSTGATAGATTNSGTTSGLPKNPRLVERLRALLPAGTDLTAAATGFKSQGQFVAAVHVSNNLGVPFSELRTRMVDQNMSLGQAIQQLRPDVDADTAARRASQQADTDLGQPRRNSRQ